MFYNRKGEEIDTEEFGRLFADRSYQRLAKTLVFPTDAGFEVFVKSEDLDKYDFGVPLNHPAETIIRPGILISTVWLGIDHGYGEHNQPVIFETMAFDNVYDEFEHERRASSEEGAMEQHVEAVCMAISHVMSKLYQGV